MFELDFQLIVKESFWWDIFKSYINDLILLDFVSWFNFGLLEIIFLLNLKRFFWYCWIGLFIVLINWSFFSSSLIFLSFSFIFSAINLVPFLILFLIFFFRTFNSSILFFIFFNFSYSKTNLFFFISSSSLFLFLNSCMFFCSIKFCSWIFFKFSSYIWLFSSISKSILFIFDFINSLNSSSLCIINFLLSFV